MDIYLITASVVVIFLYFNLYILPYQNIYFEFLYQCNSMDGRFSSIFFDHRFRPIRRNQRKIQIDRRFRGIFTEKSFAENVAVDKRGRPVKESSGRNFKRFYHLSHAERKRIHDERKKTREHLRQRLNELEVEESQENAGSRNVPKRVNHDSVHLGDDSDSSYFSSEDESDVDLARGKGNIVSSSDEEDAELELNSIRDHGWAELDSEATRAEETSRRLALCNMDWDRVRAGDIFMLVDSFKPTGGSIKCVNIYPSEYGFKRMAEEEKLGPAELKDLKGELADDDSQKVEDGQYNMEKVREYQLNRLKYYYAIITCDSVETAEKVYNECDGIEYEASSAKLDLRFVPGDMEFSDYPPKDTANATPDSLTYKPASFVTAALNQTKVNLTWDETDYTRTKLTKTSFKRKDLENMDVQDFLASSSGSECDEDARAKLHLLLGDPDVKQPGLALNNLSKRDRADTYKKALASMLEKDSDSDNDIDMEVTWQPNLKESVEQDLEKKTKKKYKENEQKPKLEEEIETDPAELKMILLQDDIGNESTTNNKDFEINVNDERFSALYKSPSYAIDRSSSLFHKSDAIEKLVGERQQRVKREKESVGKLPICVSNGSKKNVPNKTEQESVSQLVKSIKSKTILKFDRSNIKS